MRRAGGAEGDADAELVAAAGDEVGDDAVEPDHDEDGGEDAEESGEDGEEALAEEIVADLLLQLEEASADLGMCGGEGALDVLADDGGGKGGGDDHSEARTSASMGNCMAGTKAMGRGCRAGRCTWCRG